jgi:3-deoxy-D-manno-octulosonic-acid transferase
VRRSHGARRHGTADVWLGDSLGEMALYYGLADVALLGGSLRRWAGRT